MNRLLWGIAFLVLAAAGGWAQSTWRGQAEVWTSGSAPSTGFVAASNQFPKNSLLTIENYKTKKTVQVRVIQGLPVGSAALVLLNPRAAAALDMKAGDTPLVGVRIDPNGTDRPDNPDPDVNPLAEKPAAAAAVAEAPGPTVPAVTPVPKSAPVPATEASPRVPAVNSLEVTKGSTSLDPDLMPLPALASPATVAEPTPLAVADEPESPAPVTPGKMVFVTAREPGAVATETPAVTEAPEPAPAVSSEPMASPEPMAEPVPLASAEPMAEPLSSSEAPLSEPEPATEPVAVSPEPVPAPSPEPEAVPEPAPAVAETPATSPEPEVPGPQPVAPVAETPAPEPVVTPAPVEAPAVVEKPVTPPSTAPLTPVAPLAVKPAPASAWVSVPGKLEGPVLGEVAVLSSLDRGRSYVQVGAWADEASLLAALGTLKSFVPVALYRAEGEKNPWRLVVASVPKGQLGFLLMHFRSQGYRSAALVKG